MATFSSMGQESRHTDLGIAEIAERQHGVISTAQLRALGLSESAIGKRAASGRLRRIHRGVFAVGHSALRPEGRWLAAVMAIGGGPHGDGYVLERWRAAVSHRSAAALWAMLPAAESYVDVVAASGAGRARRKGILVHRSRRLTPRVVTVRHGIPATTPARTVADLREAAARGRPGALSPRELRKAIRQANVLGLPLDEEDGRERLRGDLEGAFLGLCRRHRLPRPEVNVRIGPHLVDFVWPDSRLAVETDHYTHHRGREAFRDDRARALDLKRRGYEVLQLSERQVDEEADRVAEVVAAALGRSRPG